MTITYEYKIANLEYTNDENKGVVIAHYEVFAKEGSKLVRAYGTLSFVPKPDDPNYTPFDQLTEETVLSWVKSELDTAQIEKTLAKKLNEKLNPTVVLGVPWPTDQTGFPEEIDWPQEPES